MKAYAFMIEAKTTSPHVQQRIRQAVEKAGLKLQCSTDENVVLNTLKKGSRRASPLLILIAPDVDSPINLARQLHQLDPVSHIIFLVDDHQDAELRKLNSSVAMVGTHWGVIDPEDQDLAAMLHKAVRSSHQRRQHRTTLDHINIQISSQPRADVNEYRRYAVSDRFLANILENARVAIIATNNQGVINTWNDAAENVFKLSQEDAIGRPIQTIAHGDWSQHLSRLVPQIGNAELPNFRQEIVCECLDGRRIDVELDLTPMNQESGRLIGMSLIVRDISERKRAEEKLKRQAKKLETLNKNLKRSNKELEDFAYIASHDLKEPLRGIHNYSVFLKEDFSDKLNDEGKEILATMQRLTKRMEELIDSLLYYSRVGRIDLSIRETNLNTVLNEVIDSLHVTIENESIDIRIPQKLPTVKCDVVRVREVFQNLITNAIKYNDKPDKWVEIGLYIKRKKTVFFIKDNGIGIKQRHLDKIFRIFKRLHGRDKYGGGAGAGLTIIKKIIERHSGKIWVESTVGEGTTFYFTLD